MLPNRIKCLYLDVYGGNALSRTQCNRWFEKFQNGDFGGRNEERGRPAKKLKMLNCKPYSMKMMAKCARTFAEQLNVDQSTVSRRLKAMGKIIKLLKPGGTFNTDRYKQQLLNLNDAILEKREQYKKRQHKVIFLDDNAPSHHAKPKKDIVKTLGWEPLAHAAYSPDLAPSDYYLLVSLGHALADQHFT
ncbi:mariner Mos1 transposase [Trichonephila clavipes]|nr:mariner Mos1 transposase [Trichonephila clavipes]